MGGTGPLDIVSHGESDDVIVPDVDVTVTGTNTNSDHSPKKSAFNLPYSGMHMTKRQVAKASLEEIYN